MNAQRDSEVGPMTNPELIRYGGLALLAGAIAFVAHLVLRSVLTAGVDPATFAQGSLWIPSNVLGLAGAILVLLGLPAVYAPLAGSAGRSGMIAIALLGAAWMFFGLFLSLYSLLVLPWLAEKAPSLIAGPSAPPPPAFVVAFGAGLIAWFAGAVLLAVPFLRRRLQPTWVGYVLLASALWVILGNLIIAPRGPAANLAVNLLSNLAPVLLLVGLGYLAYQAWSPHDPRSAKGHAVRST